MDLMSLESEVDLPAGVNYGGDAVTEYELDVDAFGPPGRRLRRRSTGNLVIRCCIAPADCEKHRSGLLSGVRQRRCSD